MQSKYLAEDFRYTAFICPECWSEPIYGTIINHIAFNTDNNTLGDECIINTNLSMELICPVCGSAMFECDYELAESIRRLNILGIKTMFCCTGHVKHDGIVSGPNGVYFELPYVRFYIDEGRVYKLDGEIFIEDEKMREFYGHVLAMLDSNMWKSAKYIKCQFNDDNGKDDTDIDSGFRYFDIGINSEMIPEVVERDNIDDATWGKYIKRFDNYRKMFISFINAIVAVAYFNDLNVFNDKIDSEIKDIYTDSEEE